MAMLSQRIDHVIGVDTHTRAHMYARLDARTGVVQDCRPFPTTKTGLADAQAWIQDTTDSGRVLVAIEGTGSYGAILTRRLLAANIPVAEMDVPVKRHRKAGKSDALDAVDIGRRAIADPDRSAQPRAGTGHRAALQVLLTARAAMTGTRTASLNALNAIARSHELGIDASHALTAGQVRTISRWRTHPSDDIATTTAREEAIRLATQAIQLGTALTHNETGLTTHVEALAPGFLTGLGIGPVSAARLLAAYSHPGRTRSEAAFARLTGAAPLDASSGNTHRQRLNRGGDRQANTALWRIASWRYDHDPDTQAYTQKRTAAGATRKEIIRSLKRYIARASWRQLNTIMS